MAVVWMGTAPADAAPPSMSGIGNTSIQVATGERVGYRRYYSRYGYPVPYAYYPPPYGYYVPPPAYAYPLPDIDYAGAPPPDGDYGDAPPDDDHGDVPPAEGDHPDASPDGVYGDAPPPEGYLSELATRPLLDANENVRDLRWIGVPLTNQAIEKIEISEPRYQRD